MEKIRDGESQKKADAGVRKGRKVAKHCVSPKSCGSGGSKSRLTKAAGTEPADKMRDEKLHAVVARSTCASKTAHGFGPLLEVEMQAIVAQSKCSIKMYNTHQRRTTFGS